MIVRCGRQLLTAPSTMPAAARGPVERLQAALRSPGVDTPGDRYDADDLERAIFGAQVDRLVGVSRRARIRACHQVLDSWGCLL